MKKKLLIDGRFFEIANKAWGDRYEILPSVKNERLPEETAYHPDMSLFILGNSIVAEPSVFSHYQGLFKHQAVLCGETKIQRHYPKDVAYNVLISEGYAYGNTASIDAVIASLLHTNGILSVHVNQGYAACSCISVPGGIITADPSIAKAAAMHVEVLQISSGDVYLPGYPYGFIGGACGYCFEKLFAFGALSKHRDFQKIRSFLSKRQIEICEISDMPLTDVGTIFGIED